MEEEDLELIGKFEWAYKGSIKMVTLVNAVIVAKEYAREMCEEEREKTELKIHEELSDFPKVYSIPFSEEKAVKISDVIGIITKILGTKKGQNENNTTPHTPSNNA